METELVKSILKGNTNDFAILVDTYEKMVYNLAYRIFLDKSDAEDMTQETFIKVYRNLSKCEGKQCIRTWVYTIAYNTCIDEVRKRKGKNNLSLDMEIDGDENSYSLEIASKEPTPESKLLEKEGLLELETAINQLNTNNKSLIYLRDVKGLSYIEISEIMNVNIGTVKSGINRARQNLKKILSKKK